MINIGTGNGRLTFTEVVQSTSYGSNTLSDGILEVWNDPNTLTDWTVETLGTVNVNQPTFEQTTDCYSGTYAVKITGSADESASKVFYQNVFGLSGNYILEGYIKNSGLGSGHLLFWNNLRGFATQIWNFTTQEWETYVANGEDSDNIYVLNPGDTYAKFTSPVIPTPASGNICPGLMGDYGNINGNAIYFDDLSLKTVSTTGSITELMSLGDLLLDFKNDLTIAGKSGTNASITLNPDGSGTTSLYKVSEIGGAATNFSIYGVTDLSGVTSGMPIYNASLLQGVKNGMSVMVNAKGYVDENGGDLNLFAGDAGTAGGPRQGGILNLYGGNGANGGSTGYVKTGSIVTSPSYIGTSNDGNFLVTGEFEVQNSAYFLDVNVDGAFVQYGLTRKTGVQNLANDETLDLPNSKSGWGEIMVGDNEEFVRFRFTTAGVVTLMDTTTNIDSADTDGKFCIFDNGSNVRIKNRLGSSKEIKHLIHY